MKELELENVYNKGICYRAWNNQWEARISIDGKVKQLGYFTTDLEAAKEYNKAAAEAHGEFAFLNKV